MQKNTASQKFVVFAFNRTTNAPLTGDAANITANLQKDFGSSTGTNDTNPTELEDGYYAFDATQAETNADSLVIYPASSTSDIQVIGVPAQMYTVSTGSPDEVVQTVDNNVLAAGSTGFAAIDTVVDAIKVITDQITFTTANQVDANMLSISSDGPAADNMEATYDGTGYEDDAAPATQIQASSIASSGAAQNVTPIASPNGFTLTTGSEVNDEDDVTPLNGVRHELSDAAGTLDAIYKFDIGPDAAPVGLTFTGVYNSNNDSFIISANTGTDGTPVWVQAGTITGTNSSTNTVHNFTLFNGMIVSDVAGQVQIRVNNTGLTSSSFDTDQVYVSISNTSRSVGYALGRVLVDTNNGTSGTVSFFNGVADKSTDLMVSAFTIAGNVGLSDFSIINGSAIVLESSAENKSFFGDHWTLDLSDEACGGIYVQGAFVTGAGTSSGEEMHFEGCDFGTATVEQAHWDKCGFTGAVTLNTADSYDLHGCYSKGSAVPVFTKTAGQVIVFETHDYSGDITLNGLQASDEVELRGTFGTITLNGTGGAVHVHGDYETLTGTLDPTLVVGVKQGYSGGAVVIDTNNGDSGSVVNHNGTEENPVDNFADAVLIAAGMTPLPLKHFHQRKGSSITLVSDFTAFLFNGIGGTVALGGRTLNLCTFLASNLSGIVNAATTGRLFVEDCLLSSVTMTDAAIKGSSFVGTFTVNDTGAYSIMNSSPQDTDSPPTFDMGAAVANTNLELLNWNGPVIISNLGASGTDTLYITGNGDITLDVTCTGGTLVYAGDFTLTNDGSTSSITHIGGATEDKQDTIITRVPTVAELAYIVENANAGLPVTFTTSGGSTTAAVLNLVDGSAGSATDDQYNSRLLVFTNGTLKGVVTDITDYTGSSTTAVITAIPTAPTASHTARLI